MCQVRNRHLSLVVYGSRQICCRATASGSTLKQSVTKRRNYRPGGKNYQSAEQNQPHDNWKEPEFFPLFHKRPHIHQELTHNADYLNNSTTQKRRPRGLDSGEEVRTEEHSAMRPIITTETRQVFLTAFYPDVPQLTHGNLENVCSRSCSKLTHLA
jgi:hypothetical protein